MYASLTDIGFPQDRPLESPEAHQSYLASPAEGAAVQQRPLEPCLLYRTDLVKTEYITNSQMS